MVKPTDRTIIIVGLAVYVAVILFAVLIATCAADCPQRILQPQNAALSTPIPWGFSMGLIKHAGVYYETSPSYPCQAAYAQKFAEAVMPRGSNVDLAKAANPAFNAFTYLSLTDCYTFLPGGEEHPDGIELREIAATFNIPEESLYLHWAEDTICTDWGGAQRFCPAGSRVELYAQGHQNAGKREAMNLALVNRPAQVERVKRRCEVLTPAGHAYAGIALDNCTRGLNNWGSPLVSGGMVAEANAVIGSTAFNNWHWSNLRDTMARLVFRLPSYRIAPNVANFWLDSYLDDPKCATDIIMESIGNPIRDWETIGVVAARHARAATQGIRLWCSANTQVSAVGESVSYDDMAMGCTALYLVVQYAASSLNIQNWTGPSVPNWMDTIIWKGEANTLFGLLGNATADPYIYQQGTSPRGNTYQVWCRMYERGAAMARIRQPWSAGVLDDVMVPRPSQMVWIKPDGTNATPSEIPIHNGGGIILVRA